MLFWILIALLTAAAVLAVLLPLGRAPRPADGDAHAARVYRDQLDELQRDKAGGRLSADEAEAARAEIARRLIALDAETQAPAAAGRSRAARRVVSVAALAGIPILSLSLYLTLGAPQLPGAPLAARLQQPAAPNDIQTLVAKVEAHLAEEPEDGRGWEVIAPVYVRLQRPADAAQAYRNAIRILGSSAERQAALGEVIWMAEGGIVTAEARAAFEAANALDPAAPEPRFFLALAAQQEGDTDAAKEKLTALLADAPADAPWRVTVEEALAGLEGSAQPGPTEDQVAAAEGMSPEERMATIESMVDRLAARLEAEPDDVDGWLRLIRSYVVLGRTDEAEAAARDALAGVGDSNARQRVEALIAELNVAPAGAPPGPTPDQVAAAQNMAPEDQAAMIQGMVGRLAARLEAEPDDVDGWLRLIRSYVVLGKPDAAAAAARDALAGVSDSNQRQRVEALIAELNVAPAGGTP